MKRLIILASASKRRSEILTSCGINHKISVSGVREIFRKDIPTASVVSANAALKARHAALIHKNSVVIGADTLVRMGTRLIGKPGSAKEAKRLLRDFSGNRADVYTGVCVIDTATGKSACGSEKSTVFVKEIDKRDVERYFKVLGPYDKAGGFSIEGAGSFVFDDIKGSYFNILGLPMTKLAELFKKIGLDILDFIK